MLWALVAAVAAAVFFAPLTQVGSCPSNGDCVSGWTTLLGLPVAPWVFAPIGLAAGLVVAGFLLLTETGPPRRR